MRQHVSLYPPKTFSILFKFQVKLCSSLCLFSLLVHNSNVSLLEVDSELQSQHKLDCLTSLQHKTRTVLGTFFTRAFVWAHCLCRPVSIVVVHADKHIRKYFVAL